MTNFDSIDNLYYNRVVLMRGGLDMIKHLDYNIRDYVDLISEVKSMLLDAILNSYKKCKKYTLNCPKLCGQYKKAHCGRKY